MQHTTSRIWVLIAGLTLASGSFATLIDFTPGNLGKTSGQAYNKVSMTVDGIGVTVKAFAVLSDGHGNISGKSRIKGGGTGVYVSSGNNLGVVSNLNGDSHSMDGGSPGNFSFDPDEGLQLTFNQVVNLNYVNFDHFGSGDDFNLKVGNKLIVADFNSNDTSPFVSPVSGQLDEYNFSGVSGTKFLFWADGDSDSFRLDRLKVSTVPEPSTIALFVAGLVGVNLMRRKQ